MSKKKITISICLTNKALAIFEELHKKVGNQYGWTSKLFQGLLIDKYENDLSKKIIIQQIVENSKKQKELEKEIEKLMIENNELNAALEEEED